MSASLSHYLCRFQETFLPFIESGLGLLSDRQESLVQMLEYVRPDKLFKDSYGGRGRPPKDRGALARCFMAKAYYNIEKVKDFRERLLVDKVLRYICGYPSVGAIPSESTFSRAFADFSQLGIAGRLHDQLIGKAASKDLLCSISRDSTAIEVREKPLKKPSSKPAGKRKRGRPRKGEELSKPDRRILRQQKMGLDQMLSELPKACDIGCKKDSKGNKTSWQGYKLHLDVADGDLPISAVLTSASLHDSQVSLPLTSMTSAKVDYMYELMDAAYDDKEIIKWTKKHNAIAIIDKNFRKDEKAKEGYLAEKKKFKKLGFIKPEDRRYNQRSSVERINGMLKDHYGARNIWFKGHAKIFSALMCAIIAITFQKICQRVQ